MTIDFCDSGWLGMLKISYSGRLKQLSRMAFKFGGSDSTVEKFAQGIGAITLGSTIYEYQGNAARTH